MAISVPTLMAANPTSINAVYDKVWVEEVVISAPTLGGDATARVRLRKFRSTEDGGEFAPEGGEWLQVDSLLAGAETDPDLAAVVGSLMDYVAKVGREQGVIAPHAA
jgi:hypothetical protein